MKSLVKLILLPVICQCLFLSDTLSQEIKRPKIALVLSGGGAKGFAHIGVLKVLEEEGIPIDMIVGTSMGSIVGGLHALGYNPGEIEEMAKTQNWALILSDELPRNQLSQNTKTEKQRFIISVPVYDNRRPRMPYGAIQGQNLINLFSDLAGNVPVNADFNKLPIRFACVGTDIESGKGIIIDSGFFPTAIYCSMAIPGAFYPGEHNNHVMIDGGVADNFPTDVAKAMGADIIIGVDIRNDLRPAKEISSLQRLIDQLINFYSVEKDSTNKSYCTILIRPDITGYSTTSFNGKAVDTLINRGIRAAKEALPEIRYLKNSYNLQSREISREMVKYDKWHITDIRLTGDFSINDQLILDKINLSLPGDYTYEDIKGAIDRIYGLGCIRRAYFRLIDSEKGKILEFNIMEEMVSNINVGMRLNTTDAVSVLLNYTQRDFKRYIGLMSLTAEISSNPGFNAFGEISKGKWPVIGLQLEGKYRSYNLYTEGKKTNSIELYYGAASLYGYRSIKKHTTIGMGIKEEYFKGQIFSAVSDSNLNSVKSESGVTSIYGYCSYDNLDQYYFPTKGTELYAEVSLVDEGNLNEIHPIGLLKMRNVIKLNSEYSFLLNLYGRTIFNDELPEFIMNFAGGHDYELTMNNHLPFYGIPSIMYAERFLFIGLTGIRIKISEKNYITGVANMLLHSNILFNYNEYNSIWGLGLGYGYDSRIGPLDLTVAYSDWYKKPVISANIGLWF